MIDVENTLMADVGDVALVDGHDAGSGEVNIFLLTDHPRRAFQRAKELLEAGNAMNGLRAAFRDLDGDEYEIVWPTDMSSFSVT